MPQRLAPVAQQQIRHMPLTAVSPTGLFDKARKSGFQSGHLAGFLRRERTVRRPLRCSPARQKGMPQGLRSHPKQKAPNAIPRGVRDDRRICAEISVCRRNGLPNIMIGDFGRSPLMECGCGATSKGCFHKGSAVHRTPVRASRRVAPARLKGRSDAHRRAADCHRSVHDTRDVDASVLGWCARVLSQARGGACPGLDRGPGA